MSNTILRGKRAYTGIFNVEELTIQLDEGEIVDRAIVDHPDGVVVLAYDPERRVALMISEARPAVMFAGGSTILEAIGGTLDDEPEDCARREALEEGGLKLGELTLVGQVWMTPPNSTERLHLFLAPYTRADRVAEGGGLDSEQEHLKVREVPLGKLWGEIQNGGVHDAKTMILVQALKLARPELF